MAHPSATPTPVEAAKAETIGVLLPRPFAAPFDYRFSGDALPRGTYVKVPFGKTEAIGVVWGDGEWRGAKAVKAKAIAEILPWPPMPEASLRFINFVADYTLTPRGMVLKMMLAGGGETLKLPRTAYDAPAAIAVSPPLLSAAQGAAAATLLQAAEAQSWSVTLLDGVTGSGKTEVYAEAAAKVLALGGQALIMLPEIALGAQLHARLAARFGLAPVTWHSELTPAERKRHWHAIRTGEARLVLGARSALFLPYARLGMIVVDEEHDAGYKQDEGVMYQARDMAVKRGQLENCPVVLASATPSLETLFNVDAGRYAALHLPDRYAGAQLPQLSLIDLRQNPPARQEWLSPPLRQAMSEGLAAGKQTMLFLNRRGYAPLTLCRTCGHRMQCPRCTAWLVEHRREGRLRCHHCGHGEALPEACPSCTSVGSFAACGPGVERLEEEVRRHFPKARLAVLSSDLAGGLKALQKTIEAMAAGEVDILIGTQMMAKGYHFPKLTLVGVVDADFGLSGGDPRAAERTFQLLLQVSGRSGRAADAGKVLLQTLQPEHPVMQALARGDRDAFMRSQRQEREAFGMPPYGRLAALLFSGRTAAMVEEAARRMAVALRQAPSVRVLGPAPAPLAKLKGMTRVRILLKGTRESLLQPLIAAALERIQINGTIKVQVDIDPYHFL